MKELQESIFFKSNVLVWHSSLPHSTAPDDPELFLEERFRIMMLL